MIIISIRVSTHMKSIKSFFSLMGKLLKWAVILAVVGFVAYGIFMLWSGNQSTDEQTSSEYEERVEQKMIETAEDWKQKHKVWSEQEVSKEIIAEQEAKLEVLREKELSL